MVDVKVVTTTSYKEKITGHGHDNCHGIVEHLEKRINVLQADNEELRQRQQVTVKKVETNIVEKRPGLDAESAHLITELEQRVSELELLLLTRTKEVETLTVSVTTYRNAQADLEVATNRIFHLEQELNEKLLELEALRKRYNELIVLREKDLEIIRIKDNEIAELLRRLKDLELLPGQVAAARKSIEVLTIEVDKLTALARERDQEIDFLRKRVQELEAFRCINPRDHDELKNRIVIYEKLHHEHGDLKNKYNILVAEYEKEITIVRNKDKEISNLEKTLQQEIKDSRKALDKELSNEEKLQHEIDILRKRLNDSALEVADWKQKAALVAELLKTCKDLEQDNLALHSRIKQLEEVNYQLDSKLAGLLKEIDALRVELRNRENAFILIQKEKTVLITDLERSQVDSSALLAKLNEEKNREIAALNAKLYAASQEVSGLHNEIDGLRSQVAALNAERVNIIKVLEEHTIAEKELAIKVEALKRERELLAKEIAAMVAEKDRLKAFALSKDKEVNKLDKDIHAYAKENEQLHGIIADLEFKLNAAHAQLKERDAELLVLRANLNEVTIAQKQLFEAREKLIKENTYFRNRITELETTVTTVNVKYAKLEKIFNEIRGATHQIADVHDRLLETVEETDKIKLQTTVTTSQKTSMSSTGKVQQHP